jgi:hypothetical protein
MAVDERDARRRADRDGARPALHLRFGLGIDGAAWVMAIARAFVGALSLWF